MNSLCPETLDTLIGFDTGDILWYSPVSGKHVRFNQLGHGESVCSLGWVHGSESIFVAGFWDGVVAFYDKNLADAPAISGSMEDLAGYILHPVSMIQL